jgi:Ca2+-binding RTX toxin-like protein
MATINGTSGTDHLTGGSGDDTINGLGGNDVLNGQSGDDFLYGGDGNDILIGGTGSNDFFGGTGNDRFTMVTRDSSGSSDDLIHDYAAGDRIDVRAWGISTIEQVRQIAYIDHNGEVAFDAFYDGYDHVVRIAGLTSLNDLHATEFLFDSSTAKTEVGTDYDDTLFGTAGNDTLNGGDGDDQLLGGAGNDVLIGGFGLDAYDGGSGFDYVSFAYSSEKVDVNLSTGVATWYDGSTEPLVSIEGIVGSQADNVLTGNNARNEFDGQDGNDTLIGAGGNDTLIGGKGADTLTGGTGNDEFFYRSLLDSTVTASGQDTITDFATGDHIDLVRVEAQQHESFHFIGTAAFSHTAGEIHYVVAGGNTVVSLDSNGDGVADFAIQLTGTHALSASDFIL